MISRDHTVMRIQECYVDRVPHSTHVHCTAWRQQESFAALNLGAPKEAAKAEPPAVGDAYPVAQLPISRGVSDRHISHPPIPLKASRI